MMILKDMEMVSQKYLQNFRI